MEAGSMMDAAAATLGQLVTEAAATLSAAGSSTPRLDAEVLLAAACNMDRTALYVHAGARAPQECRAAFASMLRRRIAREPVQYIVGRQEFWSLDFSVTPDVLIPRPETELLVELALGVCLGRATANGPPLPLGERVGGCRRPRICDLGTGSGCIAVALARELPEAEIWALDVSAAALRVAATNAVRHAVADRIRFVVSDLFAAVADRRFDVIVCNPPYVAGPALATLQPELRYEPCHAVTAGDGGLEIIRRVVAGAPAHLADGGWLLMEIGANQDAAVVELAHAVGLRSVSVRPDYAGMPRALCART